MVMAYIVMAYIVMAYMVMAYIVMADEADILLEDDPHLLDLAEFAELL